MKVSGIKNFFPSSRGRWILFIKTSLPVIFAAMIFAMNNFVDNFTAINIPNGNQALSYANTWTSMSSGIIASTSMVGSALFAQYLGSNDKLKIRQVLRARVSFALLIAILFALPALIAPEQMVRLISGFDNIPTPILNEAKDYTRWISISWILSAWGYTNSMVLRESGHGNVSLISACVSLVSNIILNVSFIFGIGEKTVYLAYTTIISMVISISFMNVFIWIKDKRILINPFKIFGVSWLIWKQFFKRISSFILLAIGSATVSMRFVFWNKGYPTGAVGSDPNYDLSAATILGISGMFFNIFWTTFESINANIAIFVGKELGHNNITQAKANAKELQGFHLITAMIMATLLFSLSFAVVKMHFLTDGYAKGLEETLAKENPDWTSQQISTIVNQGRDQFLENLKITLWPLSWNMPIWIWYLTKKTIIASGGLTDATSLADTIMGILQIAWIAIINLVIIHDDFRPIAFPWAYAMFFISDLIKIPLFEILYYKLNWARNVTIETEVVKEDV